MMSAREIVAELEAAARQEADSIAVLETTHWERVAPDLLPGSMACLAAAQRRRDALVAAARTLRQQDLAESCAKAKRRGVRVRDTLIALRDLPRGVA